MKLLHAGRGLVWIAIGGGFQIWSMVSKTPLTVRGTGVPWGVAVMAVGAVLLVWDLVRKRKEL
jgi:hypothetical protein